MEVLMKKGKFSVFSLSAASYFVFMFTGILTLYSEGGIGVLASNPLFAGFAAEEIGLIAQIYMIVAGALLVIKGIHSLVGGRLLAIPCLLGDIAFIAVHYLMLDGASAGGGIALLIFIILSSVSAIGNLVYSLLKNI